MKIATDLEQSKKLAEILSLESADMCWCNNSIKGINYTDKFSVNLYTVKEMKDVFDTALNGWDKYWKLIPCWSLAALLEQIPSDLGSATLTIEKDDSEPLKYGLNYHDRWGREDDIQTKYYDDLVDACYEMILKLNEQKIL